MIEPYTAVALQTPHHNCQTPQDWDKNIASKAAMIWTPGSAKTVVTPSEPSCLTRACAPLISGMAASPDF